MSHHLVGCPTINDAFATWPTIFCFVFRIHLVDSVDKCTLVVVFFPSCESLRGQALQSCHVLLENLDFRVALGSSGRLWAALGSSG